jgi:hypothetical protein
LIQCTIKEKQSSKHRLTSVSHTKTQRQSTEFTDKKIELTKSQLGREIFLGLQAHSLAKLSVALIHLYMSLLQSSLSNWSKIKCTTMVQSLIQTTLTRSKYSNKFTKWLPQFKQDHYLVVAKYLDNNSHRPVNLTLKLISNYLHNNLIM